MDRRRPAAKLLSKDEARRIAANIAKLGALRFGDMPRQTEPHTAYQSFI